MEQIMKHWIAATTTILFLTFSTLSTASQGNNINHDWAKDIIVHWFASMKAQNLDAAGKFLASSFVSLHSDGITRNKDQELKLIKNLEMKDFHLTDFKYFESKNIITVTFKDLGNEMIDDARIPDKRESRMAVLQKTGNTWLIIAYANMAPI